MKKGHTIPVCKTMCATCPFSQNEGALTEVRELLVHRLLVQGTSPICHSTGVSARTILGKRRSPPDRLCRGARDLALSYFASIGFIREASDEAWDEKRKEIGV